MRSEGRALKRRLTAAIFLIAALALLLSGAVGMATLRSQELTAARETLEELLALMDAQSQDTGPRRSAGAVLQRGARQAVHGHCPRWHRSSRHGRRPRRSGRPCRPP